MKTQIEIDASNQFAAYQKGWTAGAAMRVADPKATEHTNELIRHAYNDGYIDGRFARNQAMHASSRKYGHTISVVRLMDDVDFDES